MGRDHLVISDEHLSASADEWCAVPKTRPYPFEFCKKSYCENLEFFRDFLSPGGVLLINQSLPQMFYNVSSKQTTV